MGKPSRTKGAVAEREVAKLIRSHGFNCERTGRNGLTSEDVTHSIPGIHLEVKRCETLSLPKWIRQAARDAKDKLPVIMYRRSREAWRVDLDANEYLRLKQIERDFAREYAETFGKAA